MMWVIKLGGSLSNSKTLIKWLDMLSCFGKGQVVIVPGGGGFADQVRQAQQRWQFSDDIAHQMALLAMQQYGLMLSGMNSGFECASTTEDLNRIVNNAQVAIWLPQSDLLEIAGINQNWNVTSDSLAVWLAHEMRAAQLVVVKSVELASAPISSDWLVQQGIVDKAFAEFLRPTQFNTWICFRDDYKYIQRALCCKEEAILMGVSHVSRTPV